MLRLPFMISRIVGLLLVIDFIAGRIEAVDFYYPDFSDVAGLRINGDAAQFQNRLRLTTATTGQSGSFFTQSLVDLQAENSFSTFFRFQITDSGGAGDDDGSGADGLVFVVQTVSNSVGGGGVDIGFGGIAPSLGIEFDTFNNGGSIDPNGNHVGIDINGSVQSVATQTEPVRFNNGDYWNVWIDYDGVSDLLEVRWSTALQRPESSMLSHTVDLLDLIGQTSAYVGFTSGTGAGFGNQDLIGWEFRSYYSPVPEPSTYILGVLSTLTLAVMSRRQRRASAT